MEVLGHTMITNKSEGGDFLMSRSRSVPMKTITAYLQEGKKNSITLQEISR